MVRMSPSSVNSPGATVMATATVRAEQLVVGQHVVDQGGGVNDQVDGVSQSGPGGRVQAEILAADVSDDDFEVTGGELVKAPQQFRVTTVEDAGEPGPGVSLVPAADDSDQPPAGLRDPFQPLEGQEAAQPTVGAGEQDGVGLAGGVRPGWGVGQCPRVDELAEGEITGGDCCSAVCVNGCEGGAPSPRGALGLDVVGQFPQIGSGADDDADRYLDIEELLQQIGKGQRGQRVAAEVGEVGVRIVFGSCGSQ